MFVLAVLLVALRALGHDVTAIASDYPQALRDHEVLQITVKEERVLVTGDRDFGELIVRQRLPHSGVVLLRLGDESIDSKCQRLEAVLRDHADDLTAFIVVTERGVRVRR